MTSEAEDSLPERLAAATVELAAARQSFETQVITNERRMTSNRRLTGWAFAAAAFGILVALIGVAVGVVGIHDRAVAASDTNAKRVASCLQAQVTARTSIEAGDKHDQIEADAIAPKPRSPSTERAVEVALAAEHANTVKEWRIRNCTTEGIRDFLANPSGPHAYLPPPPLPTPTTKGP